MPKHVHFTQHAREMAARRHIEEDLVRQVIEHPGQRLPADDHIVLQQKFPDPQTGKTILLRVFVRETPIVILVLTVYKTSRIDKYWQAEGAPR